MLTIRPEQLAVFERAARRSFVLRAAAYLRRDSRSAALDDHALEAFIEEGIERAARHGIRSERQIVRYLELLARRGPQFDAELTADEVRALVAQPRRG